MGIYAHGEFLKIGKQKNVSFVRGAKRRFIGSKNVRSGY